VTTGNAASPVPPLLALVATAPGWVDGRYPGVPAGLSRRIAPVHNSGYDLFHQWNHSAASTACQPPCAESGGRSSSFGTWRIEC
jgi:hypothetical protein